MVSAYVGSSKNLKDLKSWVATVWWTLHVSTRGLVSLAMQVHLAQGWGTLLMEEKSMHARRSVTLVPHQAQANVRSS